MSSNIGNNTAKLYVRPMQLRWKELFTCKVDARASWDRWDRIALALAALVALWVFALKLQTFYNLGYSGDLFVSAQAARSWLEGKHLLQENCFGNVLAIHTYFLLLPLGILAKPFGAPGLLFVLAASVGATYFSATRILRLLAVAGPIALIGAAAMLVSPLSVAFYQEAGHGFHVETLAPAFCLILFYFLIERRVIASIVTALLVISVKEDAPIAAGIVAIVAGIETWVASAGKPARCRFNWPAAITLLLSVSAVPLLLAISWSQSPTMYAPHSVDRLGIVAPGSLATPGALFGFVVRNSIHWLGSSVVRQWLFVMIVGSLGTILLRPYYLVIGLPTTGVAWLVHRNDLLWAPRFFLTETLLWCVTLVGFASIARAGMSNKIGGRTIIFSIAVTMAVLCSLEQLALVPKFAREAYFLHSTSVYSSQERQEADALFARYRRESKPEDPVVASSMLFRYAHDRNLFWLNRLQNRPAPVWILGDTGSAYDPLKINLDEMPGNPGLHLENYTLIDRRGRFVLLKEKN
jgi:uncharacterized membrane protein